jgi:peptide/nickel transport system substrate-binding protein
MAEMVKRIKGGKEMASKLTRRDFLKTSVIATVGMAAAGCAQPTPQVIEKQVPVEKVVKETVVVEKEVAVEKVVTATPVTAKYGESPQLAGLVTQGELPPVDERLPEEPRVIAPHEGIGQYGGTWHRVITNPRDTTLNHRLTYECLLRYNSNGTKVVPNVATGWEVAPDGRSFTFSLRKGMKWSDGAPFSADDVMYYYEDILGNEELSPSFPAWLKTGGENGVIEKVDDYTIRFTFSQPHGIFMYLVAAANGLSICTHPGHYLRQFHIDYVDKAELEKMTKDAGLEFWYQLHGSKNNVQTNTERPVISAWKLTVPPPKQPLVAERNPYYWKVDSEGNQLPYIDRIEFMLVTNAEASNLRAMSGEVDMQMRGIAFANYTLYQENREQGDYRVVLWEQGKPSDTCIYPNLAHQDPVLREIIGDRRFRYAFSLVIDRQEIIDSVYLGMATPRQLSPLPSSPFYLESQAQNLLERDVERANQLLDDMGLTERDADGYRLRPDGERLSILFEHSNHFATWSPIGELMSEHFKSIGIELTDKEYARQLYTQHVRANEHDIGCWNGTSAFNPLIDPRSWIPFRSGSSLHAVPYARWYESGGDEGEEPTGDLRKVLDLFDQIVVTVDQEEQVKLWHEIMELNRENLWTVGISTDAPQPVIVKNNFRNVPEDAVSDFQMLTIGNMTPEQFYIRQS